MTATLPEKVANTRNQPHLHFKFYDSATFQKKFFCAAFSRQRQTARRCEAPLGARAAAAK